jgi:hypothetical protein
MNALFCYAGRRASIFGVGTHWRRTALRPFEHEAKTQSAETSQAQRLGGLDTFAMSFTYPFLPDIHIQIPLPYQYHIDVPLDSQPTGA